MNDTCTVAGCTKPRRRKTGDRPWCEQHYQRWRLYGRPDEPSHWQQPKLCTVAGCGKPHYGHGWCVMHAARMRKHGDLVTVKTRPRGTWRTHNKQGYILLFKKGHPSANAGGYVLEHRFVMEAVLGRQLLPDESVHHKNGIRDDNRPENLEVWAGKHPSGQRPEDLVPWAREILRRYGHLVVAADEEDD